MERTLIINYITTSEFKKEEAKIIQNKMILSGDIKVSERFKFIFRNEKMNERLKIKISEMASEEVSEAYIKVKVPCIVEHAGLIYEEYFLEEYPGGLTKPMWDTLAARNFIKEFGTVPRNAFAKAVVACCNGREVKTFEGITKGVLKNQVAGKREFYWDTIFSPNDAPNNYTYAEMVADPKFGLETKVLKFSQSAKAIKNFLEFLIKSESETPGYWR